MCISTEILENEYEKKEIEDLNGVGFDYDQEIESDSDDGFHSDTELQHTGTLNYDIDTMFEIVRKRDFNNWSLPTISVSANF